MKGMKYIILVCLLVNALNAAGQEMNEIKEY